MPYPLNIPSGRPEDVPEEYIPHLLSAIEGFLEMPDLWLPQDYALGRQQMEQLKVYIIQCFGHCGDDMAYIGEMRVFCGGNAKAGWIACTGHQVSRTTYAALFAEIGVKYGAGDGSTTFNVPLMTNRSPYGSGGVYNEGQIDGNTTHVLTEAQLPPHSHGAGSPLTNFFGQRSGGIAGVNNGTTYGLVAQTGTTGMGASHNNLHPIMAVPFFIFAGV